MINKKIFVSGCFDLIHSGHIKFLNTAAKFGDLYVSVGSDRTIEGLKAAKPIYGEEERKFIVGNIKSVKKTFIAKGSGKLDFIEDLKRIKPNIFIVNEDGHSIEKKELCESMDVEYKVLKRIPEEGLPARSSTETREKLHISSSAH